MKPVLPILALSVVLATGAAQAIELSQKGRVAYLSGTIRDGDHFTLRDFLERPLGKRIRVIYLDSPGGHGVSLRDMARAIREAGLATAVDAARARCDGACTCLFVAGLRRHYVNAAHVDNGEGGRVAGLGFPRGDMGRPGAPRDSAGLATAQMVDIYREMGVPGAAAFTMKSGRDGIYRLSPRTALEAGIVTSLAPP